MPQKEVVTISKDLAETMLLITETYLNIIEDVLEKPDVTFVERTIIAAKLSGLKGRREEDAT